MENQKKELEELPTVANDRGMAATTQKWITCSVSWIPSELKEVKKFCTLCDVSFSEYLRALVRQDRDNRNRMLRRLAAKSKK